MLLFEENVPLSELDNRLFALKKLWKKNISNFGGS